MAQDLSFKKQLARVFDDNLETVQWKNIVDGVILFFIILSTLEVFLSTYSGLVEKYGIYLEIIDLVTTIFFTIEVTLRIWTCGEIDEKYRGFKGKIRYCFSFYGLIDILATYPFYVNLFIKVPYTALKVLRICRIFRLFRYMKSFRLLVEAFKAKKHEMNISLQFLCIITFILSLILYFVENSAQPDVYSNGWKSALWAFAQYIGDPGGFADYAPITIAGRIIACIVGVLGIAIFAVPAGLIGSAFIEVIEDHQKDELINENIRKMKLAFQRIQDRSTFYIICPRFISVIDLQSKKAMKQEDIIDAVNASDCFRLRNTATAEPIDNHPHDRLVVETFYKNKPYGCLIDRGSKVTIVSTSSVTEIATGNFSFYLAMMGGFNYISKEIEYDIDNPVSFYNIDDESKPNLKDFLDDINRLSKDEDSWVIFILSSGGGQESVHKNQIHFAFGSEKGNSSTDGPDVKINLKEKFENLCSSVENVMQDKHNLLTDRNIEFRTIPIRNIAYHVNCKNTFTFRIEWSVTCWNYNYIFVARSLAEKINAALLSREMPNVPQLKERGYGFTYKEYSNENSCNSI